MRRLRLLVGDVREQLAELADGSAQTVVTSPPYWGLRDYGADGQIGLEPTPEEYVAALVDVFDAVARVLRPDGTLWLNLGDTYIGGRNGGIGSSSITSQRNQKAARAAWLATPGRAHRSAPGLKPKDLVGIPWRVAFALQAAGWYLRSDIIWAKPSPMPESVRDRPTRAHEYLFLLTQSPRYYFDAAAIAEPSSWDRGSGTRNKRSVWRVPQTPFAGAHFATFPPSLVEPCILAGAPPDGVVLDPFAGSGTALRVALELGRRAVGIEINPEYAAMARERCREVQVPLIAPGARSAT